MVNRTIIITLAILITMVGCQNPLFENKVSGAKTSISGQIRLSGEENLENIFVYLEGVEIGTYTNAKGEFALSLPRDIVAGTSLSGVFNLYGYVANFLVKPNPIAIRDGQFVFGSHSLDSKGYLNPTPLLRKILEVTTHLTRGYKGDPNIMAVTVHLHAIGADVPVVLPNASQEFLGGALIHNLTTGEVFLKTMATAGYNRLFEVTINEVGRNFYMLFSLDDLPPGEYEVIPHVLPNYDDLARQLAHCIGIDPTRLSASFLKWPVRYPGDRFTLP